MFFPQKNSKLTKIQWSPSYDNYSAFYWLVFAVTQKRLRQKSFFHHPKIFEKKVTFNVIGLGKMEFRPLFSAHPPYFCQFFPPTFFPPTLVSQFFSPTFFPPTLVSQFFSPTFFLPTPCLSVVAGAPPSCLTSNGRSKQLHGYCCLSVSPFFHLPFFRPPLAYQ